MMIRDMSFMKRNRLHGTTGASLVEIIFGILILTVTLLSVAATGGVAGRHLHLSSTDTDLAAAIQRQVERLAGTEYGALESGSEVVNGFRMHWTVGGGDPRQIVLRVERTNLAHEAVEDTVLLYRAAPRTVETTLESVE